MFKNYLKVGFRQLLKHKGYSAINISGLAIGMACFVLILLYVQDELAYDTHHSKADRIYRIAEIIEGAEESASVPFPVGETLVQENPTLVETSTRFFNMQAPSVGFATAFDTDDPIRFNETRFFFTDSTLFDVFDIELLQGDRATALARPNNIILTESTAEKYFGDDDPMGKTLRMETQFTIDFEVVGIVPDAPRTAHFEYDLLGSMATMNQFSQNGNFQSQNWFWNPAWTYVVLPENVTKEQVEARFPGMVEQYFPDAIKAVSSLYLQPLTDIHLRSNLDFEIRPNSNEAYVYIFSVIAIFVLLIACINFMNLSTARSAQRAREVGVRKAAGALRFQLISQFLGESMISAALAGLLAIPLIFAALPALNAVAGKALTFGVFANPVLWAILLGVPLLVGLLSGSYPALFLSAFQPASVLKGTFSSSGGSAAAWLRKGLVAAQFTISIVLIAGTIVAYNQLEFMQNKELGFDKEEVVLINVQLTPFPQNYDAFKAEAEQQPNIEWVTMLEDVPGSKYQTNNYQPEGVTDPVQFPRMTVHDDFVETFGMEMAAGRGYQSDRAADTTGAIVINSALVDRLGWGTPEDAIGRTISQQGFGGLQSREVIGVVDDFHYASLHNEIGPFVIERYTRQTVNFFGRYVAVRITPNDVEGTLAYLEDHWNRIVPTRAFDYFFLDQELDQMYKGEATLGKVATTFSLLAILVACLGLFGMASFTAERRTKEIGVRKVLGASVGRIIFLLSRESVILVGIAFLIASPIAYFAVDSWLNTFSYRTDFGILPLIFAGGLVLIISWATVGMQSLKAASVDPVESLKYE